MNWKDPDTRISLAFGFALMILVLSLVNIIGQSGDSTTPGKDATIRLLTPPQKVIR
jgi:hypothetical protein